MSVITGIPHVLHIRSLDENTLYRIYDRTFLASQSQRLGRSERIQVEHKLQRIRQELARRGLPVGKSDEGMPAE